MTASVDSSFAVVKPPRKVPDFFIVGHFKCGTTALHRMLSKHPEIYMPQRKESWFFSPELRSPYRKPGSGSVPDTLDEYLSLFDGASADQRIGEATPSYLTSHTAARRIAELAPDARIIAILREPASFLHSFHLQCVQNHTETVTDLRKALALEGLRREGKAIPPTSPWPRELIYSDHVRYVQQLERYHAEFPREQVLVLIYDDFRDDNEATMRRVLRFLDVDDSHPLELADANPTVRVRSQRLYELTRSLYLGRGRGPRIAKAVIKRVTLKEMRDRALRETRFLYGRPKPPDERLMLELRRQYGGEVAALSEYLDRDLVKLWGYDDIG